MPKARLFVTANKSRLRTPTLWQAEWGTRRREIGQLRTMTLSDGDGLVVRALPFRAGNAPRGVANLDEDRLPTQGPDVLVGDPTVSIDEEGLGDAVHPVVNGDSVLGVPAVHVRDPEFLDEAARGLLGVLDVHPEKDDSLILVTLPGLLQQACLRAAWRAPGGPEVQEDHLPAEVREPDRPPVKEGQGEVRRRLSRQDGGDGPRVRGEPVGQEGHHTPDRPEDQYRFPPAHVECLLIPLTFASPHSGGEDRMGGGTGQSPGNHPGTGRYILGSSSYCFGSSGFVVVPIIWWH